ncbi:uncharacterized protein EDB93DRAFT_1255124 [Suillus bovinus]|uniref:uncharacterized protein n=1 Tax=Suillus bovinus TaxID=48563 RepID=UPI001B86AC39|nr:uncharacterized protein EDB93DRAFT_1255124 [Suillus bovinus]KAG2132707.1 hypothetical protein EDB93DRAFT_1255124 [Suillus bovinus]
MDPKPSFDTFKANPSSTITCHQMSDIDANADRTKTHQVLSPTHIHAATEIPVEILCIIMELTMPPTQHFLDSTVIARDNRSSRFFSLQTLRNNVLVCRYWYSVGISFLYRHVVILKSKQLFALARVVSNNHTLGKMILSLRLQCYVSVSQMATVSMALDGILAVTPNLTKVTLAPILKRQPFGSRELIGIVNFMPIFGRRPSISQEFLRLVILAQHIPLRTTDLHFHVNSTLKDTLNLMPAFTYLTTFHIDIITGEDDELPTERLHLAFLEELQITWYPCRHDMNVFSALAETLSLPSLRRLLLTSQALEDRMVFEPLLRKFGNSLHFVSLVRPYMNDRYRFYDFRRPFPLTPLLSMCPNLRHLATDTCIPIRMPAHAHLTWVDLWAPRQFLDPSEQSAVTLIPHEEKVKLPSLRGVRLLDMSLFSFSGARTPLLIPPDMVGSTESVVWSYSNLDLRHDPGLLYRHKTDEVDDVLADSLCHRS